MTSWFAPPWSGPQRAQTPADGREQVGAAGGDHADGRGGAVLLVVGVEEEEEVEGAFGGGADDEGFLLGGEHQVEEVGGVAEVVAGLDGAEAEHLVLYALHHLAPLSLVEGQVRFLQQALCQGPDLAAQTVFGETVDAPQVHQGQHLAVDARLELLELERQGPGGEQIGHGCGAAPLGHCFFKWVA